MATYYWIGGTGNWNDTARWSLTSGGSTAGVVPGAGDDVIFNASSDTGAAFTATVNAAVSANNMTITTDQVVTIDGTSSGNLTVNAVSQNNTTNTAGATFTGVVTINNNYTHTKGVLSANGNLIIGNTLSANGFSNAVANRCTLNINNTIVAGNFIANSTTFYKTIAFAANSQLILVNSNSTMNVTGTSANFVFTGNATNTNIISNYSGSSGTRNIFFGYFTANANSNWTNPKLSITAGTDNVICNVSLMPFGGIDLTGFSGNFQCNSFVWSSGNITLSNTANYTTASDIHGFYLTTWSGQNATIITNNAVCNFSLAMNGRNTQANTHLVSNIDLIGNRTFTLGGGNVYLQGYTVTTTRLTGGSTVNSNVITGNGQIILTGSNTTILTGGTTSSRLTWSGNVNITANYTGSTGTRTMTTGFSNIQIRGSAGNGLNLGNVATDTISIPETTNYASINLQGFIGTLKNDTRNVMGEVIFGNTATFEAGSNITTIGGGPVDDTFTLSAEKELDFPITCSNRGILVGNVLLSNTRTFKHTVGNIEVNGYKIRAGSWDSNGGSLREVNCAVAGSIVELTAGNRTVFNANILGSSGFKTANAKFKCTFSGSTGNRVFDFGNAFANANSYIHVQATENPTLNPDTPYIGTITIGNSATDNVIFVGSVGDLDLTGCNANFYIGSNLYVTGNITLPVTGGNYTANATNLFLVIEGPQYWNTAIGRTINFNDRTYYGNIIRTNSGDTTLTGNLTIDTANRFSFISGSAGSAPTLILNEYKIKTGSFFSNSNGGISYINWGSNSLIEVTGSNGNVFTLRNQGSVRWTAGNANFYLSYSGGTGNRNIMVTPNTGSVNTTTLLNLIDDTSLKGIIVNPAATDKIVLLSSCYASSINFTSYAGELIPLDKTFVMGNFNIGNNVNLCSTAAGRIALIGSGNTTINLGNKTNANCFLSLATADNTINSFPANVTLLSDYNTNGLVEFGRTQTVYLNNYNIYCGTFFTATNIQSTLTPTIDFANTSTITVSPLGGVGQVSANLNKFAWSGNFKVLIKANSIGNQRNISVSNPNIDVIAGNSFINNAVVIEPGGGNLTFFTGNGLKDLNFANLIDSQNVILQNLTGNSTNGGVYGNLTLTSGNYISNANAIVMRGSSGNTFYINYGSKVIDVPITFNGPNATWILSSNANINTRTLTIANGTLDMNGYTITSSVVDFSTGNRTVIWDSGTINIIGSSQNSWLANNSTTLTFTAGTGVGNIRYNSTGNKSFFGGNTNFNAVLDVNNSGNLTLIANNTFDDIKMSYTGANNWIRFPAGGITTVRTFTGTGTGNSARFGIISNTSGTRSNIALSGGGNVNINFAMINDINFTPMVTDGTSPMVWYVGANSINDGNVSGALFTSGGANAPIVYAIESGTSWTVPNNWNSSNNIIHLYGAGGGGGGSRADSTTSRRAGSGGGGGGYTAVANFSASPNSTITYAIGTRGSGGSAGGGAGGNGGNTTWSSGTYYANGGTGGTSDTTTTTPGVGGAGANYRGGNGGAGGNTTSLSSAGAGGGGGGGAGGPSGNGGGGGSGSISATAGSTAGGGGGGSGGGTNGANASAGTGGQGGNNASGVGGAAAGINATRGGGGGGGANAANGGLGGGGVDIFNSIGGGGGVGGPGQGGAIANSNSVLRMYGGGGAGGAITTTGTAKIGGSGGDGGIIVVYYVGETPVGTGYQNMFLLF